MPDYSEALKKFRESGYPKDKGDGGEESSSGVRTIKLTDDEKKSLEPYQQKFGLGEEMVLEVTGRLEDHGFRISSVKYAEGGESEGSMDVNADAEEMMSKYRQGPMMQTQTIPSPS